MFKLYVTLSDFCNFSCSHCINSSAPKAKRWRLSESDRTALVDRINSDERIKLVMFSGGEPTLHVETIVAIQKAVLRPVEYRITSNGWLGSRFSNFLDQVNIAAVTLSYDKFHQPFVNIQTLVEFISVCIKREIPVAVNFVFDSIAELVDANPLIAAGATLDTCRLIRSGRGKNLEASNDFVNDLSAINGSCPSLIQKNLSDLEKVVFIPGEGLTPCCGPLAFDQLLPSENIYSPLDKNYLENPLRSKLLKSTFLEVGKENGIDLSKMSFGSRCEACVWLHSKRLCGNSLSVLDVLAQKEETAYYTTESFLDRSTEQQVSMPFIFSYFLTCSSEKLKESIHSAEYSADSIRVAPIDSSHAQLVTPFMVKNYYQRYSEHYSQSEIEALSALVPSYFTKLSGQGRIYFKGDQVVGLVLKNQYAIHPALQSPTTHVGYWGYDCNEISREDARFIKRDWLEYLTSGNVTSDTIDCSIEWFNSNSLEFAKTLGFELKMIRLDRRTLA